MNKNNYCTIYIVRHGQTDWNVLHRLQGHSDIPLNSKGINEAKALSSKFKKIYFAVAYSSDLSRASKTTEIVLANKEIEVKLSKALREHFHGSLEGTTLEEQQAHKKLKEALEKFYALPTEERWHQSAVPNQETSEQSSTRFINELRAIAVAHPQKNVLVGSHGGIMARLLMKLGYMGMDDFFGKLRIKNTAYIKLRSDGVDFFVDEVVGLVDNSKIKNQKSK